MESVHIQNILLLQALAAMGAFGMAVGIPFAQNAHYHSKSREEVGAFEVIGANGEVEEQNLQGDGETGAFQLEHHF